MLSCMAFITAIETLRQVHRLSSVPLQRVLSKIFPEVRAHVLNAWDEDSGMTWEVLEAERSEVWSNEVGHRAGVVAFQEWYIILTYFL